MRGARIGGRVPPGLMRIDLRHAGLAALLIGIAAAGCSSATPESTRTSSAAVTVTPPASFTFASFRGPPRPVVAVGRDYVYAASTGYVDIYFKAGDGSITSYVNGGSTSFQVLFGDLSAIDASSLTGHFNNEVASINSQYAAMGASVQKYVPPCAASSSSPTGMTGACADRFDDGDTVYDEYTGRFFVMTKLGRPVYSCTDPRINLPIPPGYSAGWNGGARDSNGNLVDTNCYGAPAKYVQAVVARPILVAVSQCYSAVGDCEGLDDTYKGPGAYALAEDSWDWAQINVSRGLLMVDSRQKFDATTYPGTGVTGSTIYGFSAQSLANGTLSPHWLPTPGFMLAPNVFGTTGVTGPQGSGAKVTTSEQANQSPFMFAEMHGATNTDWPMMVTTHGGNQVWAYDLVPSDPAYLNALQANPQALALWDLSPWMTSMTVSTPSVVTVPSGEIQEFNAHPVWSGTVPGQASPGMLYWSFVNSSNGLDAFAWPKWPWTTNASPALTQTTGYEAWHVATTNGADFPVLSHNYMSGDDTLLFHTFSPAAGTYVVSSYYAVNGATDPGFPSPVLIQPGTGPGTPWVPSSPGKVDVLSNVSDPLRPEVFMTSVVSTNGALQSYVTAVPMPDGALHQPPSSASVFPSSLQIQMGTTATATVSFGQFGSTSVTGAPVTCSVGGDLTPLGIPPVVTMTPGGATVTFTNNQYASGTHYEGISCTNGISVSLPVTFTPSQTIFYPDTAGTAGPNAGPNTLVIAPNSGCTSVPLVWNTNGPTSECGNPTYTNYSVQVTPALPLNMTWEIVAAGIGIDGGFAYQTLEICAPGSQPIDDWYNFVLQSSGCGSGPYTTNLSVQVSVSCQPTTCAGRCASEVSDGCGRWLDCTNACTAGSTCMNGSVCCPDGMVLDPTSNACVCPTGYSWYAPDQQCLPVGNGKIGGPHGCKGSTCM